MKFEIILNKKSLLGPLTSFSGIEGMAYINTKYNDPRIDWPDAEIHLAAGSPASDYGFFLKDAVGITQNVSYFFYDDSHFIENKLYFNVYVLR